MKWPFLKKKKKTKKDKLSNNSTHSSTYGKRRLVNNYICEKCTAETETRRRGVVMEGDKK